MVPLANERVSWKEYPFRGILAKGVASDGSCTFFAYHMFINDRVLFSIPEEPTEGDGSVYLVMSPMCGARTDFGG